MTRFRGRPLFTTFLAFVTVLAISGCAKKKGLEGASTAASRGATDSGSTSSENIPEMGSSGSGVSLLNMPTIYFDYNQATVRADGRDSLKKAADQLKASTNSQVTIEGHCDERGSSEYNLALGERRAQSVRAYLRTLGVGGSQLSTISYGKERPVDTGHDESAWAKNRRAEIIANR